MQMDTLNTFVSQLNGRFSRTPIVSPKPDIEWRFAEKQYVRLDAGIYLTAAGHL